MAKILDNYSDMSQIKKMSIAELEDFSLELREFLIQKVSKTGGHLASSLGVVELTLSIYKVFDLNFDKLVWDVGHQAYVHKILTGRKDKFDTLRQFGGISGFPKRCESIYDCFETGHSSTSISAALGIARARDLKNEKFNVIAVIGDGALTGGLALEALNDAGFRKTKMVIILNDNQMSISKNVGGISRYLSSIRLDPKYNKFKGDLDTLLHKIPSIGNGMVKSLEKFKNGIKQMFLPGMFFEEIGIKYLGPIDGHDIKELSRVLSMAQKIDGPVLVHTITTKGKGYTFAEDNPGKFHGIGPFDSASGEVCVASKMTYSSAFGNEMVSIAAQNENIVAITAAMRDGTGLKEFAIKYPKRFFDVGIAEQHAVTLAAGMASGGLRPVFAVYSTFLQRAYDQVLHDVCLQKLSVIFAIDRAGIVGEDGETHQGVFDISYLSHIPNMTIMSPKCIEELRYMLHFAVKQNYPIAIRYPRGSDKVGYKPIPVKNFEKGKWEVMQGGGSVAIIACGKMVSNAVEALHKLSSSDIDVTLINACFIKPIDKDLIRKLVDRGFSFVTVEDNVLNGGFGALVRDYINTLDIKTKIINIGFKDEFIPHGKVDILYKLYGLDSYGIVQSVVKLL